METLKFKSEKIIGRQNEITQLQDSLNELKQGKGKTIIVSGEAGVGKTRLMNENITYMESQGIRTVKVYCLPHENTDSYLPFTEMLHKIAPDEHLIPKHEELKHVSIDEVFLIYKSGVLIAHTSKKDRGLDSDVVAGMFTAVQDFVKDSFGDKSMSTSGLRRLEYHDMNILIEHGKNVFIAGLLVGPTATKSVFRDLRGVVELIEKDYPVLEKWDGDMAKIKGTETILKMLTGKDYPIEKRMDKAMLDTERLRVFEHMLNIVTNTAKEKPLLLFFDDLQWADPSSLHLLHYLSRNTRDYPVLLCGAYRPEDLVPTAQGKPHPLKETMGLMGREELITNISLDRLKHEDTADLVKGIFAHSFNPGFTQRLHEETEGNPFFTEELLRAMVLDGVIYRHNAVWEAKDISKVVIPSSVKDTVMRRINALDKDCQEVLKYASVIGQYFNFQTLQKTANIDEEKLAEILESIEKRGIIHSEEEGLRFDHAKLQEVIHADVPKYRRNIMHKKTAQALEELNQENPGMVAVELTYHYQQANMLDKTVEYALLSAETAEKKFTPSEAAQHYTIALQTLEKMKPTPENKEQQLRTADKITYMYYITGEWDMSMNYVYVVEKLAKETKNQPMLAESYRNMGMIQIDKAEYDKALGNLQNALRISEEINDYAGMCEVHFWMGKICWRTGKLDDATVHLSECLDIAEKKGDKSLLGKALMDIGIVHYFRGEYKESLEQYRRSLGIAEELDDKYEVARAYNNIGVTYGIGLSDYARAIKWFEKCVELGRKIEDVGTVGYGLTGAAEDYAKLNQNLDKAKEYNDEALNIFVRLGEKRMIGQCHRVYGVIYHKKGDWDRSMGCFEKAIKIAIENDDLEDLSQDYFLYGKMFADKGDKTGAREQFQKSIEVYEKLGNKQKVEEVKREMEKL
ncbi:MAG: tetratricopeptide repeat protein [Candidatus Thermoplasmatota archaeon]|nr:tetratricopeptide repeat protein [Candidatus Thermoplasmatota archaeon]